MTENGRTVLPVRTAAMRGIGWLPTCHAGTGNTVAGSCGNVTTHVRLIELPGLLGGQWMSVCPLHTTGRL